MALGLCCQYVEIQKSPRGIEKQKNIFDERILQLGRWNQGKYSEQEIRQVYLNNADNLLAAFRRVVADGYKCFRVSSNLIPLADKVPRDWWDNDGLRERYWKFGELAKREGVRITMHPGQFVVLSSDSPKVVNNAVADLETHAWIMEAMELDRSPFYAINIHGGKGGRPDNLIREIKRLPDHIRNRLTLENCETAYSAAELKPVCDATGVPIVLDVHHHTFRTAGVPLADAIDMATQTWRGIKPLQHLSNTSPDIPAEAPASKRRAHSDWVHYIPNEQRAVLDKVDVEMEFKMKNWAIELAIKDLGLPLS